MPKRRPEGEIKKMEKSVKKPPTRLRKGTITVYKKRLSVAVKIV